MKAIAANNPSTRRPACVCVITCHNYAHFLRECLDSCLTQTWPFDHILVVDDASSDDTAAVCVEYAAKGVRYLRTEFADVALARNAGIAALPRTSFILNVDADNRLPTNYRELLQRALGDLQYGVAYGNLRFLETGQLADYIMDFDYWQLRRRNYADTCSVVRREAFDQAGGFAHNDYGLQDWELWLKITRLGWDMIHVPSAELGYRVHAGNMSNLRVGKYQSGMQVMENAMLASIVTLFSGRTWALAQYARWLKSLEWNRKNLHIVAVDNSRDEGFGCALRAMLDSTGIGYTWVPDDGQIDPKHSASEVADTARLRMRNCYEMNVHLSRLYARAREYLPARADLVWCVEDDVEPGPDALQQLALVLFRNQNAGMIAGCLRSRFEPQRLIGWRTLDTAGYLTRTPALGQILSLAATGFFCTLFPRPMFEALHFRPGDARTVNPYYDWAASSDVRALGMQILMTGSVPCGQK